MSTWQPMQKWHVTLVFKTLIILTKGFQQVETQKSKKNNLTMQQDHVFPPKFNYHSIARL